MSSVAHSTAAKTRILVVDDDTSMRQRLCALVASHVNEVWQAGSLSAARAVIAQQPPDVALLEYRLPDGTALELLADIKQSSPDVQVIVIAGHARVKLAVETMHAGAFFFLEKPVDSDQLESLVEQALDECELHREARARLAARKALEPLFIAESAAMRQVQALLLRYAESASSTVLITGENGVGKDVVARQLHAQSPRSASPIVTITCSAAPDTQLESELFGHDEGAFPGAKTRPGLIEQARNGSVLLDEIEQLPPPLQAKLLRFLEEGAFRRLGSTHDIHADVRIIAATHRDLSDEVLAGRFRRDLYYRLSVLQIVIPPLRERRADIAALAYYFVACFNRTLSRDVQAIAPEALAVLEAQPWAGNARELRNVIERAMVLTNGSVLGPEHLHIDPARTSTPHPTYALPPDGVDLVSVERDLVKQALERARGNQTRAAKLLGISRDQMRYRIEKFRIDALDRGTGM